MKKPQLTLLGVYKLEYDEELVKTSIQEKYGSEYINDKECKEAILDELDNAYLVELMIENIDGKFNLSDISQAGNDQAAYDEYYFSMDYVENYKYSIPQLDKFKVLFWFHYLDIHKPLFHSYGSFNVGKIEKMPAFMKQIMPYEPVD